MAHHVVDRDAGGEGHTTLQLLALLAGEGLLDLLLNHRVNSCAHRGDVGAWDGQLDGLGEAR